MVPVSLVLMVRHVSIPRGPSVQVSVVLVLSEPPMVMVMVAGVATCPVPLRLTVCGLPGALSVTLSVPVRAPAEVGEKVALIVQLLPAAKVAPQLLL